MADERNVPEIRFKGFAGEWSDKSYSKLFAVVPNNSLSRAGLNNKYGIAKNIHYGDVLIKYGEVIDAQKTNIPYINDSCFVDKCISAKLINGDVIIADAAEDESVGKCSELKNIGDQIIFSGLHTIASRPIIPFATGYLGYYINSSSYHDQLLRLMQGTKVLSVSKSALQDTIINYPLELLEQSEIGTFFQSLDSLITLHQRKYDKLTTVKKAMFEKMFPKDGADVPEIRFKGYADKWRLRHVSDVIEDYIEKTTMQNQYPVLTSSQQLGVVLQENYFANRQVTTDKNIGYFVLPKGYFTYRSRSDTDLFVFNRNNIIDKGIISYFYPVFNVKDTDSDFFLRRINHGTKQQIAMAAEGTGQRVLSHTKFKKLTLLFPLIEEQKKIGSFFQILDAQLTLQQRELDKLKKIKKACLEKMFV